MTTPSDKSVLCPTLIGRDRQRGVISRALEQATRGKGQVILVSGEAGMGKSRLAVEAKRIAAQLGMGVLQGNCFDYDHTLPYGPVIDLLQSWFTGRPPIEIEEGLGPTASEIIKLAPELNMILPKVQPSPGLDPDQERRRLFHGLTQFISTLAATQPRLVILEDLHWSDDSTFDLLLYLTLHTQTQPILFLFTCRSEELHPALTHFLAELDRHRLGTEVQIGPFGMAETEAMLRAIFDLQRPVRREFLEAISQLTEGNPFFIEEILKSLLTAGDIFYDLDGWDRKPIDQLRIPRTIQDSVQRRSEHVSEAARRVLSAAAVKGQRFDFDLLQRVTGIQAGDLLGLVKELIAAQLVVEESAERFAFRHALTRQAIYAQLLGRERRELHEVIAQSLERVAGSDPSAYLEDLAYHFHESEGWGQVLDYSRRAGEKAQDLYAPQTALDHFDRALEAADHLSMTPPLGLLRSRALVYETLGEWEKALADQQAILGLARSVHDRPAEWQALLDLGMLWASRDYATAGDYYRQALDLARTIGNVTTLAHSLNRLGNWHTNQQSAEAQGYHQEALGIFQKLGDERGVAETLDLLALAKYVGGDLVAGTAYYEAAAKLFRKGDDRQGLASVLATLTLRGGTYQTDVMLAASSLAAATADGEEALAIARGIGWRSGEAYSLWQLAFCLGPQGEYQRALTAVQESIAIAEEIGHLQWIAAAKCAIGALHLDILSPGTARPYLEEALALARELGSPIWICQATSLLATVYLSQNDLVLARALLEATLDADTPSGSMGGRQLLCAKAELALALGSPEEGLTTVNRLITSAANMHGGNVIPRLWALRGEALAALNRPVEAELDLLAAREAAVAQNARPLLWRILLTLGKLHQGQKRYEEARNDFAASRAIITELATKIPDKALRDNFLHCAVAKLPAVRPLSARQAAKQQSGGLTEREREVAALVAGGKSNRDIAQELVVSERTAEAHVTNILGKLGLTSRAQIAAWARERDLFRREG